MKDSVPLAVHVLLDCSGSMGDHKQRAVDAMNAFLDQLAMSLMPASVTMSRFNSDLVKPPMIADTPIYDLPKLTADRYGICGGTAIFRALIHAIEHTEKTKAETKVMVVLTDGISTETLQPACHAMVRQRQKEGWLFLFLGMAVTSLPPEQRREYARIMNKTAADIGVEPEHMVVVDFDKLAETMQQVALLCLEFKGTGHTEFKKGKGDE